VLFEFFSHVRENQISITQKLQFNRIVLFLIHYQSTVSSVSIFQFKIPKRAVEDESQTFHGMILI